jgi:hypothetical protein
LLDRHVFVAIKAIAMIATVTHNDRGKARGRNRALSAHPPI